MQRLLTDAQGNLWILLQNTKLLRYREGKFELNRGEAENGITAMGSGASGTALLSSVTLGTLAYDGVQFAIVVPSASAAAAAAPVGSADELSTRLGWSTGYVVHRLAEPNSAVISLAATGDGRIWLGTQDRGLYYQKERRVVAASKGLPDAKVTSLLPLEGSELWVGTRQGVVRWNGRELTRAGVPAALAQVEVLAMMRDRDANIWVGTTRGLLRCNASGVSALGGGATASTGPVTALFEDREGNLWVGRTRGIERLRDSAFVTYSVPGVESQSVGALYVDADDNTWIAPMEGGLRWLKGERSGAVGAAGLGQDVVYSIAGTGRNELWIGRQRGGLTQLREVEGRIAAKTYTQADGLAQDSVYAVEEASDGTVWAGTLSGGVSALKNEHFTNYTTANGLASNTVLSMAEGGGGTMWFGTPNGLSALSKEGWRGYGLQDGLPSAEVNCLLADATGVLWIGTGAGLAFWQEGRVHVSESMPQVLHEPIFGMAEDKRGWLWIATANHVLQVRRAALLENRRQDTDVREYGLAEGLHGSEGVKRYQSVMADARGRIWFSTNRGVSVVNPARATINLVPALVQIEAVLADGSPVTPRDPLRVSARQQRTTFRFKALSLANSERVRYRYRLDDLDKGWSEPSASGEASYANLSPGSYRFRVTACNSDGVWNSKEATVGFQVQPMLWQTWWFRLCLLLCAGLAVLGVYRARTRELARLLNVRFEERLAERTRIAQELHDTLLQGVMSASMQLHVAVDLLQEDSPVRPALNRILELTGTVIDEGRNTLRGLRASVETAYDLKTAFSRIPRELGTQGAVDFRVIVEGRTAGLDPGIRKEVYSIGREAVTNAFRHSGGNRIDVALEYTPDQLRVMVRDNGRGIDPNVLQYGQDGHWGLSGMRERAERIGAKLKVWSREGAGTEVELSVPGSIAFESAPIAPGPKWLQRFRNHRRGVEMESKRRVG